MWIDPQGVKDLAVGLTNIVDGLTPVSATGVTVDTGVGEAAVDSAFNDFNAGLDATMLLLAGEVKFAAFGAAAAATTWESTDHALATQLGPK